MDKKTTLQTVERALSFLEFVASATEPPSIQDVSNALRLNITTCYHLMRTLMERKYIKRDSDGLLELDTGVKTLFDNFQRTRNTEETLEGIVKRIATLTQETSFLSLKEGNSVVLKSLIEGSHRLQVTGLYQGLKGQEYRRASGKAVLAYLNSKERAAMLKSSLAPLPEHERKDICKSLDKELKQTSIRGWSIDDQTEDGIVAIGAPIFDGSGSPIGAFGIITPIFRMDKSRDRFLNIVTSSAAEATQLLKNIKGA